MKFECAFLAFALHILGWHNVFAQTQPCVTIQCPASVVAECETPEGTPVSFFVQAFTSCGSNATVVCSPPSGSLFGLGTNTVICVATDDLGNSNECRFAVTVADTTAPQLQSPAFILLPCESPAGARVSFTVTATDQCDTNVTVTSTPPSGTVFPIGTNTVQCQATDAAGNAATSMFDLVVTGSCEPDPCLSIVCPDNIVTNCDSLGGVRIFFSVDATNQCGSPPEVLCDPPSGSVFPAGISTVLCRAVRPRGAPVFCSFTVEVLDEVPPVLDCPSNLVVEAQGPDGAVVTWPVRATDNCDSNVTVYCDPPSGRVFPIGSTRVICWALDQSGNMDMCGFSVTVTNSGPFQIETEPGLIGGGVLLRWSGHGRLQETLSLDSPVDWQDTTAPVVTNGNERTMALPITAVPRFFRLCSTPLAPPPDTDGDGVPDDQDRCPLTPAGLAAQACGCAWIELVRDPSRLTAPTMRALSKAQTELNRVPEFAPVAQALDQHRAELQEAESLIRAGQIPAGVALYGQAAGGLEVQVAALERLVQRLAPDYDGVEDHGHILDADLLLIDYQWMTGLLREATAGIRQAEATLATLQGSITGQTTVSGTISRINNSERWIQLETGLVLGLVEKEYQATLTEGSALNAVILNLIDGTGLVETLDGGLEAPPFILDAIPVKCLSLAIAPVQAFPPFSNGPFTLHSPAAYDKDGVLWLEQGMRLGITGHCPAFTYTTNNTVIIYRMKLDLKYWRTNSNFTTTVTLAENLTQVSPPVPLPTDIHAAKTATLTATFYRQECLVLGVPTPICSQPQTICVQAYALRVREQNAYGWVSYNTREFDLEDSAAFHTDFRVAFTDGLQVNQLGAVSQLNFKAQGYRVNDDQSSYPNVKTVVFGQNFAVHAFDFVSPFDLNPLLRWGTDTRSALVWPRVTGKRNGHAFSYSCRLPSGLVRDVVAFCNTPPNVFCDLPAFTRTFYRLPFTWGWPLWRMGQANCGGFTHTNNSKYAFDMVAPQGTLIRAARGGEVVDFTETNVFSCYIPLAKDCLNCSGNRRSNFILIEHQDGTLARYVHMPENGVFVQKGQRVHRGDVLGLVGNTGCSTTPHLHFMVRNTAGSPSIPISFQAWSVCEDPDLGLYGCPPLRNCYVPRKGDILFSTQ